MEVSIMSYDKKVNEAFVVERMLLIPGQTTDQDTATLKNILAKLDGILNVIFDSGSQKLRVMYDATQINYIAIEKFVGDAGYPLSDSRWSRLKRAYYHFTDENVQSNAAKSASACCSHPQGIYGKHGK